MYKLLSRCKILLALVAVVYSFSFTSCISYKNVPYFQDLDSNQVKIALSAYKEQTIQKNDLLGINIVALNTSTATLFGPNTGNAGDNPANGLLVDGNGEIEMPTLGKIKVAGLTTNQFKDVLTEKVAYYVKNPTVTVRILNFKISVTGEVGKAGTYQVPNEKITVLEAIAMAGDLKVTGKRENVLVIRQENNEVQFARLDLRSKKVFASPYFYLRNNDVLYIQPSTERLEREDNVYRNTTVFLGILTAVALAISRLN